MLAPAPLSLADGRAVLHTGDALDVLRGMGTGSADAIVTDPPYATAGGNTNGRASGADTQYWAYWFKDVWREVARVVKPTGFAFIFCDWRMIGTLGEAVRGGVDRQRGTTWALTQALVWDREGIGLGAPFRGGYEMIGFARGPEWKQPPDFPRNLPAVVRHRWPYTLRQDHGAKKPHALIADLLRPFGLPEGAVILDPFFGSGSTAVACLSLGLRFVGAEREEECLPIAELAISSALAQPSLFPA